MNAIFFDFDGTIADSFDEVLNFLCRQAHHSADDFTADQKAALRGLSMRELALKVGVPTWRLPLTYFAGKAAMSRRMNMTPVCKGMDTLLKDLHDADYQLYIFSSNSKRNINLFLAQHGMGGYFEQVYGNAGWFSKAKLLRTALKEHNLDPAKTVYVGDEYRDIIAANLVGMPSVAVNWGFGTAEKMLEFKPTLLVHTAAELQKSLLDWGN